MNSNLEVFMRKLFLVTFLSVGFVLAAQQNEDLFNTARLLIYGENPLLTITGVNDDALWNLLWYGGGAEKFNAYKQLSADDGWLLCFLVENEMARRQVKTKDEFLLYLHDRDEEVNKMPMSAKSGRASGWLLSLSMAVRTGQLSVGP
jgi:hypothetical protein